MKVVKFILTAIWVLTLLWFIIPKPAPTFAAINPQCVRDGPRTEATTTEATGVIRESVCNIIPISGPIGEFLCSIVSGFLDFLNLEGNLSFSNSTVPTSLQEARNLALSGTESTIGEENSITGSIAKMLPPNYKEDNVSGEETSPVASLTRAEGVLTLGDVILNNRGRGAVYGDVDPSRTNEYALTEGESSNSVISNSYFADIVPVYDRFGFLQRSLVPNAGDFSLPDPSIDCSASAQGEEGILQLSDPDRTVDWDAHKNPELDDPESNTDKETATAQGDLAVNSAVGFVKELWGKLAGSSDQPGASGVFNILLPPDTEFRVEESKESTTRTNYDPASPFTGEDVKNRATIPIAYLGNVGGALNCIIDGLTAHPAKASSFACQQALETPFGAVACTDEATPLEFPNTAGSGIANRAWEIVNRLYQGFWCLWNWSKDDYPELFDEDAYRREPFPPYPLPPGHSGNLFWCTELVRHTYNDLSLSTNSAEMAKSGFGAPTDTGGPSNGRWISITDATYQNIRPGYVIFFIVPGPTSYRLNHVGIVYSVSVDGLMLVQSNAGTKSLLVPVADDGRISGTVGNFRVMGFGRP